MGEDIELHEKGRSIGNDMGFTLGPYREAVDRALVGMKTHEITARIWSRDHTVWKQDPAEITNRLGWLHIVEFMQENLDSLISFTDEVRSEGFTRVILLGMGGSSLAPEVFGKIFHTHEGYLKLSVLDSTDPDAVSYYADYVDPEYTLFIVATKSGGTVETLSFFNFFYNWVERTVGTERAGEHFIAITDPGSSLVDLAERYRFRSVFINDPEIGGRYAALSYFGLVPAALIGVDLRKLLNRASEMADTCRSVSDPVDGNNSGARLGAVLGELSSAGRNKVTIIASPAVESFGDWLEQLIAESTGKEGKGILPVVGESLGAPEHYGDDRLFVYLRLNDDDMYAEQCTALVKAGFPLVVVTLSDIYDLGKQFFLWEMATAVACYRLGVNPFDQPDVEASKIHARQMVNEFKNKGSLPDEPPSLTDNGVMVFGTTQSKSAADVLTDFIEQNIRPGSYVALQAYVKPEPATYRTLQSLRMAIRNRYRVATTLGFGPRFLHSTGQLHKGDGGRGLFIQITSENVRYVSIPDEAGKGVSSMSFGILKMAQALGDRQALMNAGRKVIRFHMVKDLIGEVNRLTGSIESS